MKQWFTPSELAELKLPGLPSTDRAIQMRAKREVWESRKRAARGGGFEYPVATLPETAQAALRKRHLTAHSKALVAQAASTAVARIDPAGLKTYQRDTMQARAAILAHIDALVLAGSSLSKAINALVGMAKAGELPPGLAELMAVANARAGAGRTLSRATVYNWIEARAKAGGNAVALAPSAPAEEPIPEWAGRLMDYYARPTKPSLAWAVEQLAKELRADLVPSYDQARRFLMKLDTISRNVGRMGPRALKSYRAYVARDTSELWPTAVYVADGHCFDAEVSHPRHGRPFRPEITTVVDVYTRRIVGWAIGLSENKWDVSAAAVRAFRPWPHSQRRQGGRGPSLYRRPPSGDGRTERIRPDGQGHEPGNRRSRPGHRRGQGRRGGRVGRPAAARGRTGRHHPGQPCAGSHIPGQRRGGPQPDPGGELHHAGERNCRPRRAGVGLIHARHSRTVSDPSASPAAQRRRLAA